MGVAQLVELLVVVQAVGGSSPLAHLHSNGRRSPAVRLGECGGWARSSGSRVRAGRSPAGWRGHHCGSGDDQAESEHASDDLWCADNAHGLMRADVTPPLAAWVRNLSEMSDTPNKQPAAAPSTKPLAGTQTGELDRARHQQRADSEYPGLQRDQSSQRGSTRDTPTAGGYCDCRQSRRRDGKADPLPAAKVKTEEPLGNHCEEHQSPRGDRLHNRQLDERERADMKHPRYDRSDAPDRPPLRGKQAPGAAKRMATIDWRCVTAPR